MRYLKEASNEVLKKKKPVMKCSREASNEVFKRSPRRRKRGEIERRNGGLGRRPTWAETMKAKAEQRVER